MLHHCGHTQADPLGLRIDWCCVTVEHQCTCMSVMRLQAIQNNALVYLGSSGGAANGLAIYSIDSGESSVHSGRICFGIKFIHLLKSPVYFFPAFQANTEAFSWTSFSKTAVLDTTASLQSSLQSRSKCRISTLSQQKVYRQQVLPQGW